MISLYWLKNIFPLLLCWWYWNLSIYRLPTFFSFFDIVFRKSLFIYLFILPGLIVTVGKSKRKIRKEIYIWKDEFLCTLYFSTAGSSCLGKSFKNRTCTNICISNVSKYSMPNWVWWTFFKSFLGCVQNHIRVYISSKFDFWNCVQSKYPFILYILGNSLYMWKILIKFFLVPNFFFSGTSLFFLLC